MNYGQNSHNIGLPRSSQTSDEFDSPALGLQWEWQAGRGENWYSLAARPGWLRLWPQSIIATRVTQPNLLLQKLPIGSSSLETKLRLAPMQWGEEAGLVLLGDSAVFWGVRYTGTSNHIVLHCQDIQKYLYDNVLGETTLRAELHDDGACAFSFMVRGQWVKMSETLHAIGGAWMNARVGLYSVKSVLNADAGCVDFDYFRLA